MAKKAIEEGDFHFVTVIGNRIMTNLYVADRIELMILGWIMRDMGADLLYIKAKNERGKDSEHQKGRRANTGAINEVKKLTSDYLTDLENDILINNFNSRSTYDKYSVMQSQLKKFILSDNETAVYVDQDDFSKQYVIKMVEFFYDRKDATFLRDNKLIPIISNELARNYNEHGGKIALTAYFVFKTLGEFYKYASFELFNVEPESRIWDVETRLNAYFDLIREFKSYLIAGKMDSFYDTFDEIIIRFGSDFRLYYMNYGDLIIRDGSRDEKIELSPKSSQKIGEIIAKSLEKRTKSS